MSVPVRGWVGEEGAAGTGLGAGGRGARREHRRVTAGKDPASRDPGEGSIREPAAPLALKLERRTNQGRERHETREGRWKRQTF